MNLSDSAESENVEKKFPRNICPNLAPAPAGLVAGLRYGHTGAAGKQLFNTNPNQKAFVTAHLQIDTRTPLVKWEEKHSIEMINILLSVFTGLILQSVFTLTR